MTKHDLSNNHYINRELSWINFNERVLAHALDKRTPLLEQAKFSAIFSNNLDEFFMVRVASLKSQVEAGLTNKSQDGQTPLEQLKSIREHILPLLEKQQEHFIDYLKPNLNTNNIYILNYKDLNSLQRTWVDNYFRTAIFPVLTPLAVDPAHPFPFVSNLSLNVAALISDPESKQKQFTRVKVPQKTMDRFICIPQHLSKHNSHTIHTSIPIEQVVGNNLDLLFPGMKIEQHYFFRVTRDADLELRDLEADDLMSALEEGLRKRRMGGEVVRLEVSDNMPNAILELLKEGMDVEEDDLYKITGMLGIDEIISLVNLPLVELKYKSHNGSTPKLLIKSQKGLLEDGSIKNEEFKSIFSIIRR